MGDVQGGSFKKCGEEEGSGARGGYGVVDGSGGVGDVGLGIGEGGA